jgi:hypothetical protein
VTSKDMLPSIRDDNEGQDARKRVEKIAKAELRVSADVDNTRGCREAGPSSRIN